jgi:hypothetical protein
VTTEETYQEAMKRLTTENCVLRGLLKIEQRGRRDEVRVLKAQLREGLTPELLTLRREIKALRTRATTAESRLRAARGETA